MRDVKELFDHLLDEPQPPLTDGLRILARAEADRSRRIRTRVAGGALAVVVAVAGGVVGATVRPDPTPEPVAAPTPAASAGSAPVVVEVPAPSGSAGTPGGTPTRPASGPPVNPDVPVDPTRIPKGSAGSGGRLVRTVSRSPAAGPDGGVFRTVCAFSHMNFDDPLGAVGRRRDAAYLHTYFGNTDVDAESNPESLSAGGNSTCRGGILDRSSYRIPSLVDTRTGTPLAPTRLVVSFFNFGFDGPTVHALPAGLSMVTGNEKATGPQTRQSGQWTCDDGVSRAYRFWPNLPDYCGAGARPTLEVRFPQCWNGRDLDPPDHRSHVAYAVDEAETCPSTHQVRLPQVTMQVEFGPLPAGARSTDLRLSSDRYGTGAPGGYSWHGTWIDGWDGPVRDSWTANCNRANLDCGADLIAPGRSLYGEV